jgi:Domain of unknown function (DUF222)
MPKTRQSLPEGLAEMPPGPELAAVLAEIDLGRLSGADCVTVMQAQHRQVAHEQARLMAAMAEVARCGIGPDDELPRMTAPDEFSADEIRGALVWTRAAADTQLSLAWDLLSRIPQVFATLERGSIDVPKARVFSDWTSGLTNDQARQICERLLPVAPELTTGQLCERIKKMAIAIDPDWSRRRYEQAIRDRTVVGYRNEDGSANLCGYQLPADRAAAACAHLDALAKKIKRAGDGRPINRVRADLYLAMLDGSYTGWSEQDIIAHTLTMSHDDLDGNAAVEQSPDGRGGRGFTRPRVTEPAAAGTGARQAATHLTRRAGVEVRVEITTLLGLDDHPGELPGSGPIHADVARRLVREQTAAEWRFAVTDDDGRLLYEGLTRRRPRGYPSRATSPCRGGVVELHITLITLRQLADRPERAGGWANVIADLVRRAAQPDARQLGDGDERGSRSPSRPLRHHTEIRDRTCTHPRCRMPAHNTDGDHIEEWARGGRTHHGNIGSACRHDHRLRHEGGWAVHQPRPGYLIWISRLGIHYHVPPPLIIEPLPDPMPRESRAEEDPIWRAPPEPPVELKPPPPPDPAEPIPF